MPIGATPAASAVMVCSAGGGVGLPGNGAVTIVVGVCVVGSMVGRGAGGELAEARGCVGVGRDGVGAIAGAVGATSATRSCGWGAGASVARGGVVSAGGEVGFVVAVASWLVLLAARTDGVAAAWVAGEGDGVVLGSAAIGVGVWVGVTTCGSASGVGLAVGLGVGVAASAIAVGAGEAVGLGVSA